MIDKDQNDILLQNNELRDIIDELNYQLQEQEKKFDQKNMMSNERIQYLQNENDNFYIQINQIQFQKDQIGDQLREQIIKNNQLQKQLNNYDSYIPVENNQTDKELIDELKKLEKENKEKDVKIQELRQQLNQTLCKNNQYRDKLYEFIQNNEEYEVQNEELFNENEELKIQLQQLIEAVQILSKQLNQFNEKDIQIYQSESMKEFFQNFEKQIHTQQLGATEESTIISIKKPQFKKKPQITNKIFELNCIEEANHMVIDDNQQNKPIQMQQIDQEIYVMNKKRNLNQYLTNQNNNQNNTQMQFQDTSQQEDEDILFNLKPNKSRNKFTNNHFKNKLNIYKK